MQQNDNLSSIPYQSFVLKDCPPCTYCNARRFQYEPPGFCCSSGQVVLVSNQMPSLLKQLFSEKDEVSRQFQACVRTYNNTFAFTSLGIHNYDKKLTRRNKGIYTFKVQGQMYHFINDLVPGDQLPKNLQLYFFDTDHEVENRIKGADRMEASVVENLIDVLGRNPYSQFFRNLKDMSSLDDCNIVIRSNASLDQRVYNMPTSSQVAAIWVDEQDGSGQNNRDIRVLGKTGQSHSVKYYYGCYNPLQYPLLFPHGESGWHEGISKVPKASQNSSSICEGIIQPGGFSSIQALLHRENENFVGQSKRNTVSCREYYAYRFQIRPNDQSMLLHSGRLFQQFIVDTYIKIETQRLDYFRTQQRDVRTERKNHKFYSGRDVDAIVGAEIPDPVQNPSLHSLVAKHMIHGPCGSLNPQNPCMVENSGVSLCKSRYPKRFSDATVLGENSYPTYKRRDNSRLVTVHGHQLDNKWVIPYNSYLLSKFDCHINVEVCATIKCVKYIYKYIYKGHDRVAINLSSGEGVIDFDEIKEYQNARWVSPPEAAWRVYGFTLAEIKPCVVDLQIHLENYQYMRFDAKQALSDLVDNQLSSKTMLTQFFL
nr:Cleavage stimulating factor 64 [Ipomoea batatas]